MYRGGQSYGSNVNYLRNIVEKSPAHQRNYLINGLKDASDNDLILVSDSDEIPNLKKLNSINKKFFSFSQKAYCYKLNLSNPRENDWIGSRGCLKKDLISTHR